MDESRPIWLVGMMGAGKSTLGPLLARRLGRPFVDTDDEIERRAGRTIPEIFAEDGEARFRELEAEAIRDVPEGAVVALGGGAIAQPGAGEALAERGTVVYLKATAEQLLARIGDADDRPLLRNLSPPQRRARLDELLETRRASYETAGITIDAGDFDRKAGVEAGVEALAGRLEKRIARGEGG